MCVNQIAMVPAVVNFMASKGKDTYSGFISEFGCFKCGGFSVRVVEAVPRYRRGGGRFQANEIAARKPDRFRIVKLLLTSENEKKLQGRTVRPRLTRARLKTESIGDSEVDGTIVKCVSRCRMAIRTSR
jgi:hypothetical protein